MNTPNLINCPACKPQVSSQAAACPNCGQPLSATGHRPLGYKTSSYQLLPPQPRASSFSLGKVLGSGLLALAVALSLIACAPSRSSGINAQNKSAGSAATASPTPNENSPDYQAGYKKGFQEGKSWARLDVEGMPYPVAISAMAKHQAVESKAGDAAAWQGGWEDGFKKGFRSVRPAKFNEEDFQPLSWDNAKPGVKLYGNEGDYQATVVAVNQTSGTIKVKYSAERGGAVSDKDFTALSQIWFVRKDDPALKR